MVRPFEVPLDYLQSHVDELVGSVFGDLESQFLVLPRGHAFVEYGDFSRAFEVLKRATGAFREVTDETVWSACRENALCLLVLRTILGMTPPEWAELTQSETSVKVPQGAARSIDQACRSKADYLSGLRQGSLGLQRVSAMIDVAVDMLQMGAPPAASDTVHRLAKVDTSHGLLSLQNAADQHVPYAILLYERYLGRPFASHRDSVSELVGEVMESAIEERLTRAKVTFRKTKRAERVPGFDQAPDFVVPDEFSPAVAIEAKITGDDGTARDKVTRIIHLTELRDRRIARGDTGFQVVACIDGRGFGIRRDDMRRLLVATEGKVFTLASLDELIDHTLISGFVSR